MRHLLTAACLAALPVLAPQSATAQVATPLSGTWTAHPQAHAITGCDAELAGILEMMAQVMKDAAGSVEIEWREDRFDAESLRVAQGDGDASRWFQPAPDLVVAVPRHRGHDGADGPVRIAMRITAPDVIETRILVDATTLRRLEHQPVAAGTETCRLVIDSEFRLDV